jgi:hypothetical protein
VPTLCDPFEGDGSTSVAIARVSHWVPALRQQGLGRSALVLGSYQTKYWIGAEGEQLLPFPQCGTSSARASIRSVARAGIGPLHQPASMPAREAWISWPESLSEAWGYRSFPILRKIPPKYPHTKFGCTWKAPGASGPESPANLCYSSVFWKNAEASGSFRTGLW